MRDRAKFAHAVYWRRLLVLPALFAAVSVYSVVQGQAPDDWNWPRIGDVLGGWPWWGSVMLLMASLLVIGFEGEYREVRHRERESCRARASIESERDLARAAGENVDGAIAALREERVSKWSPERGRREREMILRGYLGSNSPMILPRRESRPACSMMVLPSEDWRRPSSIEFWQASGSTASLMSSTVKWSETVDTRTR